MEAFLCALPWHFAREIEMKRIDSIKQALGMGDVIRRRRQKEEGSDCNGGSETCPPRRRSEDQGG